MARSKKRQTTQNLNIEFTVVENHAGTAAKHFKLRRDGQLASFSAAQIFNGSAGRHSVRSLREFVSFRGGLKSNQALVYGVPGATAARVVPQRELGKQSGAIARDRNHFSFREGAPGIAFLDHDPRKGECRSAKELDAAICAALPGLEAVERVWLPSSSAFIYAADGRELIGAGGWRCYFVVDDASKIPGIGLRIFQNLWKAGLGYITLSKAGGILARSLVDASVWQPERLDFAAEPVLGNGLLRKTPKLLFLGGEPLLATAGIEPGLDAGEWRRNDEVFAQARKEAEPEAKRVRDAWIKERVAETCKRGLANKFTKRIYTEAALYNRLLADFCLICEDGSQITVRELLADRKRFDGVRFADPVEPEYRGDTRIAVASMAGRDPYIYSHAHGGVRYSLASETAEILVVSGERPQAVDETLEVLRHCGDFYQRAGEIVQVCENAVVPVSEDYLADWAGRNVRFIKITREKDKEIHKRIDVPPAICRNILAKRGEWGLQELRGVITAPTLRQNGTVLCKPGYDAETGLLLLGESFPEIPARPGMRELQEAFSTLWTPFAEFPFATPEDAGVHLAACLTALVRWQLPTAPGVSYDAPAPGTGKTKLATCVQALCGMSPAAIPETRDDEELRKRLMAALRGGQPAILLDNISGDFKSSVLEALLTSQTFSDRKLGSSEMLELPTRTMILLSGNNLRPSKDLFRRIVTCRLDARMDAPEMRRFDFDPVEHCTTKRQELVAAGLTLLAGFIMAGQPRGCGEGGRLGSFEGWDDLIRTCVLWVRDNGIASVDLGDPIACVRAAKENDPERQQLAAFLAAVSGWQGGRQSTSWKAGELAIYAANAGAGSDLLEALLDIADNGRGCVDPKRLGIWLNQHRDMRAGGEYIERLEQRKKTRVSARWRVATDAARHTQRAAA